MTESLLQKLEEKIMSLLSENERLRSDLQEMTQINMTLEMDRDKVEHRMSDILGLFDTLDSDDHIENAPVHVAEQAVG